MTYRQLQIELISLRNAGLIEASFKCNQKRAVLEARYAKFQASVSKTESNTYRIEQTENGCYKIVSKVDFITVLNEDWVEEQMPRTVMTGIDHDRAVEIIRYACKFESCGLLAYRALQPADVCEQSLALASVQF